MAVKKIEEAANYVRAGGTDRRRHDDIAGDRRDGSRCRDPDKLIRAE